MVYWIVAAAVLVGLLGLVFYLTRKADHNSLARLISDTRELSTAGSGAESATVVRDHANNLRTFSRNCPELSLDDRYEIERALIRLNAILDIQDWYGAERIRDYILKYLESIHERWQEGDDGDPGPPLAS